MYGSKSHNTEMYSPLMGSIAYRGLVNLFSTKVLIPLQVVLFMQVQRRNLRVYATDRIVETWEADSERGLYRPMTHFLGKTCAK